MSSNFNLSTTLRGAMAPWFLGDLDGFISSANQMRESHCKNSYPPHNVFRINEDTLVLQMALAGIDPEDLSLVSTGSKFTISYEPKNEEVEIETQYKSISTRRFSKTFKLEEPWDIKKATLNNGLLEVVVCQVKEPVKTIQIKIV
jgi:molecular chaperone IbpA